MADPSQSFGETAGGAKKRTSSFTFLLYGTDVLRAVIWPEADDPAALTDSGSDGLYD